MRTICVRGNTAPQMIIIAAASSNTYLVIVQTGVEACQCSQHKGARAQRVQAAGHRDTCQSRGKAIQSRSARKQNMRAPEVQT